jgi:hypothetical protein
MNRGLVRFSLQWLFWAIFLSAGAYGCDDDDHLVGAGSSLVGGPCRGDLDCAELCATGGEFPYGTCTLSCTSDYNCPAHAFCVDKKGGICLPACYSNYDCRLEYRCQKTKREGAGGDAFVCIN